MLVLVQGGLAGPVIKRIGAAPALIGGVAVGIISYTLLAIAPNGAGIISGFSLVACRDSFFRRLRC